jgi:glutaminase
MRDGMKGSLMAKLHAKVMFAIVIVTAAAAGAGVAIGRSARANDPIEVAVENAYSSLKSLRDGSNADYVPALAKVDPDLFGIAVVTVDGHLYTAGDVKSEVSIQSISKVFTMARVFQDSGEASVRDNVGVDATGQPFNSIAAIEQHKGKEMNPLVNAGAIATTSMVKGRDADEIWQRIIGTYNAFAGRELAVNDEVYGSESATNQRNQAIAMLMNAYEHMRSDPQQAVDLYTRQCSVNVNAVDLATMAATLANGGRNPVTGNDVIDATHIPGILAVMATAGLYDESGRWLFSTGLPAKSGVGGGLIAVAPGKFGIAVISPPLDRAGNSVRGQRAIAQVSKALNANPYAVKPVARGNSP